MLIAGVRGVGKTVLLNRFEEIAQEFGWQSESYEARKASDLPAALARICRKVLLELSTKEKAKDRAKRALGVLKAFTATIEGVKFQIDVDAVLGTADSGSLADDLRDLLLEVGEVAQTNRKGVLILLDEVQVIGEDDYEALIVALHRVSQKQLPVAFIGAGLPTSRALSAEVKTYAERMFVTPTIGELSPEAARAALVEPAKERGIQYDDEALEKILAYSSRYPFFLQKYGREVWLLAEKSPITGDVVDQAKPLVEQDLDDNFFTFRMTLATPGEVDYLAAMADLGDDPQQVSAIATRAGYKTSTAASPVRDSVLKKNLVWAPKRGYLDFTAPLFADYLRRKHPVQKS
jgi:hypothetical protein